MAAVAFLLTWFTALQQWHHWSIKGKHKFFLEWWDFGKGTSLDTVRSWIHCTKSPGKWAHLSDNLSNNKIWLQATNYILSEEEILAICEGIWAAFEVAAMESEMLLSPHLLVLCCLLKGEMALTFHITSVTWNKWTREGKQGYFSLLDELMDWSKHRDFCGVTQGITTCSRSPRIWQAFKKLVIC